MKTEDDVPMPLTPKQMAYALASAKHEAKPEQHYERFLCLNGEFEGRGLIVPMPATYACGYDLLELEDGTHVAVQKEPMATPGLTA